MSINHKLNDYCTAAHSDGDSSDRFLMINGITEPFLALASAPQLV